MALTAPPSFAPTDVPICVETCFRHSCDWWAEEEGYTCTELVTLDCDCDNCGCWANFSTAPTNLPTSQPSRTRSVSEVDRSEKDGADQRFQFAALGLLLLLLLFARCCYQRQRRLQKEALKYKPPDSLLREKPGCFGAIQQFLWDTRGFLIPRRTTRTAFLGSRYNDHHGEMHAAFGKLGIGRLERLRWLDVWARLDSDNSNLLSRQEFNAFFELKHDNYSTRLFDLFDRDSTGLVPLKYFLPTIWAVCALGKAGTQRLAFNLINGGSALTLTDIERFVKARYRARHGLSKRRAFLLFGSIGGGSTFQEFCAFSETNATFLALARAYQNALRRKLWGEKFWVKEGKRRKLKETPIFAEDDPRFQLFDGRSPVLSEADFWVDFPEIHDKHIQDAANQTKNASILLALEAEMSDKIASRLLTAFELFHLEPGTIRCAFVRWKARARRFRASVHDALTVHSSIQHTVARPPSVAEIINDVMDKQQDEFERPFSRNGAIACATNSVVLPTIVFKPSLQNSASSWRSTSAFPPILVGHRGGTKVAPILDS